MRATEKDCDEAVGERATRSSALRALARSCRQTRIFSGSDGTSTLGELTGDGELSPLGRIASGDGDRSATEFRREDRNLP